MGGNRWVEILTSTDWKIIIEVHTEKEGSGWDGKIDKSTGQEIVRQHAGEHQIKKKI